MRPAALPFLAVLPLFLFPTSPARAHTYTPERSHTKPSELGFSEEEARRTAAELGINTEEVAKVGPLNAGPKIQVSQASAPTVEATIPATSTPPAALGATVAPGPIPPDTAPAPPGSPRHDCFGYDTFELYVQQQVRQLLRHVNGSQHPRTLRQDYPPIGRVAP
jgi:pyruvate/2-oxoglutarate dehydrogenase complex dihydrolipoamide acyltransferase (E2) component